MRDPKNSVISKPLVERGEIETLDAREDYWTPERMAAATPLSLAASDRPIDMFAGSFEPEGDAQFQPAQGPDGNHAIEVLNEDLAVAETYTTSRVRNRAAPPYATVGKMFMKFGREDFVGTGWTIAERAVFTAGHCVFDRRSGEWADTIKYVPQYHVGQEPLGHWVGTQLHALDGWTQNLNAQTEYRYDLAVFEVDRPIRPRTGKLGWAANISPNQGQYTSIGFPADTPFDGREMWQSVGSYINGQSILQMHNNMTGGCSGGPWTIAHEGQIYANGLNSHKMTNNPYTMYSPYFGEGFLELLNLVKDLN